mmetsp:Transcript_90822/g.265869  ORF Transcript_90822/g.265869 Transcript_90822/m.265869 type:complete len:364 (+) Transcript_90822:75-1166(+)
MLLHSHVHVFLQTAALLMPTTCLRFEHPPTRAQLLLHEDMLDGTFSGQAARFGHSTGRVCSGLPYQPPRCPACQLNSLDAPRLFVPGKNDGLGERSMALILGMALAETSGLNFGGLLVGDICPVSHNVNTHEAMSSLVGEDVDMLCLTDAPNLTRSYPSVPLCQKALPEVQQGIQSDVKVKVKLGSYQPEITKNMLAALRRGAAFLQRPLKYSDNVTNVALHIRRGDLDPEDRNWRWISDSWYYELVEKIRRQLPGVHVHVFSSTAPYYSKHDFEGYARRGMFLHLDGDVLDTWAHMAHADILVRAVSKFSLVPALLNKHCVLDTAGRLRESHSLHFVRVQPTTKYVQSPAFDSDFRKCQRYI